MALVAAVLPRGADAGIIVNLGKLEFELGPNGRTTRQLEVANTDNKSTEVTVFVSDWAQDENGAVEAIDPSKAKAADSASAWIGVDPQRFVLQQGEKKIVTVSIAAPKGPLPLKEYRSMVFTETADTRPAQTAAPGRELQVRVINRIGTKIFLRNPQGEAKLDCEVTKVAEATRDAKRGLEIQVANRGDLHLESDNSKVSFRNAAGVTVETQPVSPFSILPGKTRTAFFALPEPGKSKLEKGKKYNALAVIDYGGNDLVAGELELTY
jgi:P pilus assembly chaperone PapD